MVTQKQAEDFQKDYVELCKKHGLQITFSPQWKQSLDTGAWFMVIAPVLVEYKDGQSMESK